MTDLLAASDESIARCAATLREGGIVAFPTDTVYGVGVAWARSDRLPALFELKRRPADRQIPVLVSSLDQVREIGALVDDRAVRLAERWWPGPLTIVVPTRDGETLGVRSPDHPVALALIEAAGPLLATSANISGEPDTLGADEVLIAFATDQERLAAVVDGGAVTGGVPSTVIDLTRTPARVLRQGPLSATELGDVVEIES